jgi:sec-independent protein translocase protein TatA
MPDLGVPELLIVAVIVLLLFGPGKAADIGGALGRSIREFRKASNEDEGTVSAPAATLPAPADVVAPGVDTGASVEPAGAGRTRFCIECGTAVASDAQKFCTSCGTSLAQPVA